MNRDVLRRLPVGARVVVRHLIDGGERATDALGRLTHMDDVSLTVTTRRGPETIAFNDVVVAKVVPEARAGWRVEAFLRRGRVVVVGPRVVSPLSDGSATVALMEGLVADGIPVLMLDDGTGQVPEEPASLGLESLVPLLTFSPDLRQARPPDSGAFAAAHADIERRLGRVVGRAEVHFTDDKPEYVDAARAFGWQARVFTSPP